MKKRKIIALTLLVAFLCSLCIPCTWAIAEDGDNTNTPPATENEGMEISKTAKANGDDTYTITLEAYATGKKIVTEETKDVPTDIILVLDRSGSMGDPMSSEEGFHPYAGQNNFSLYNYRFNNSYGGNHNLYYPVENGHVEVSVDIENVTTYIEQDSQTTNSSYNRNSNNLYIKGSDGEYQKVTVNAEWGNYIYTVNGTQIAQSSGWDSVPDFGEYGPVYVFGTDYEFTYYYQLPGQERVVIETSIGWNTVPNETYYGYGTEKRMDALKLAATNFIASVGDKAKGEDKDDPSDDVQHRLAVVSYANNTTNHTNGLIDMTNEINVDAAKNAVNGLQANGGTLIDGGIQEANNIFQQNPISSEDTSGRQRVVIVFTDGAPGNSGAWGSASRTTANNAVNNAYTAKNTYGATVYTIGIFSGADASNPDQLPKYYTSNLNDTKRVDNSNRFMHLVSSNYPNAMSMSEPGGLNSSLDGNSYYLSASDADTLNNIFQQISDNIESGGSNTTLGSEAVIRDVISQAFNMPENANDIKVYTADSDGSTDNWEERVPFNGTVDVVKEKGTVSVSGFSFKDNWCGSDTTNGQTTFHDGKKLIIEFNVVPKDDFLGGNGVYTNTSAGVYENAGAENPLFTFERPQVDVPIKDITVKAEDKNVYLTGSLTKDQLKAGTVLKFGDKEIDLSKANDKEKPYGLEPWQTEYVTIAMGNVKDKNGNVISDSLNNLTENQKYTVTVDITPTTEGKEIAKSCSGDGNINVFKPELTFKDSEVYYGDFVPTNFDGNLASTVWKHENIEADAEKMGTAPTLTMIYTPDSEKTAGGKINSKTVDIPVDVSVKIDTANVTENTTFHHECSVQDVECEWNKIESKDNIKNIGAEKAKLGFLLHPKTCQLTVRKTGGAAGEPYVFNVYKDGDTNKPYSQVTIVGNDSETIVELPVGTYTIKEDTGWSWRYNPAYSAGVTLSKDHASGTLTCTNTKSKNYWLNGYSNVVKNTYGQGN